MNSTMHFIQASPDTIVCLETGVVYKYAGDSVRANTGYAFTDIREGHELIWGKLVGLCGNEETTPVKTFVPDSVKVAARGKGKQ